MKSLKKIVEDLFGQRRPVQPVVAKPPTPEEKVNWLIGYAGAGNMEKVRELIADGVPANGNDAAWSTPLLAAARNNQIEMIALLIAAGAELDKKGGSEKETALIAAASCNNEEAVRFLVDSGASLNKRDSEGNTALMFAAFYNYKEVAKILIEAGAETGKKNHFDESAFSVAQDERSDDVMDMLLNAEKMRKKARKQAGQEKQKVFGSVGSPPVSESGNGGSGGAVPETPVVKKSPDFSGPA